MRMDVLPLMLMDRQQRRGAETTMPDKVRKVKLKVTRVIAFFSSPASNEPVTLEVTSG